MTRWCRARRAAQGYLPSNRDRHASALERKRADYRQCVSMYFSSASTCRTDKEQALLRQVLVDVPRTTPGIALFQTEFVQRVRRRVASVSVCVCVCVRVCVCA